MAKMNDKKQPPPKKGRGGHRQNPPQKGKKPPPTKDRRGLSPINNNDLPQEHWQILYKVRTHIKYRGRVDKMYVYKSTGKKYRSLSSALELEEKEKVVRQAIRSVHHWQAEALRKESRTALGPNRDELDAAVALTMIRLGAK